MARHRSVCATCFERPPAIRGLIASFAGGTWEPGADFPPRVAKSSFRCLPRSIRNQHVGAVERGDFQASDHRQLADRPVRRHERRPIAQLRDGFKKAHDLVAPEKRREASAARGQRQSDTAGARTRSMSRALRCRTVQRCADIVHGKELGRTNKRIFSTRGVLRPGHLRQIRPVSPALSAAKNVEGNEFARAIGHGSRRGRRVLTCPAP